MGQQAIYFREEILDKLKKEDNMSKLINNLLLDYYSALENSMQKTTEELNDEKEYLQAQIKNIDIEQIKRKQQEEIIQKQVELNKIHAQIEWQEQEIQAKKENDLRRRYDDWCNKNPELWKKSENSFENWSIKNAESSN